MIFESERLGFRLLEQGDLDELFNKVWGSTETMRFCGGAIARKQIPEIIEYNRGQYNTYGNAIFAVIKNDRLLGICGGEPDEEDPLHVELIIHLAGEYQHQGYGTEALKAYVEWLRAGKKATYIYASVHPDNQASLNMTKKCASSAGKVSIISACIYMTKKCGLVQCGFRQYEDTGFVDEPYFELILD